MRRQTRFLPRLCGTLALVLLGLCLPQPSALAMSEAEAGAQDDKMLIEVLEGEEVEYLDPDWVVIGMDEYQAAKQKTEEAARERESKKRTLVISASVGAVVLAATAAALLLRRKRKRKR